MLTVFSRILPTGNTRFLRTRRWGAGYTECGVCNFISTQAVLLLTTVASLNIQSNFIGGRIIFISLGFFRASSKGVTFQSTFENTIFSGKSETNLSFQYGMVKYTRHKTEVYGRHSYLPSHTSFFKHLYQNVVRKDKYV